MERLTGIFYEYKLNWDINYGWGVKMQKIVFNRYARF